VLHRPGYGELLGLGDNVISVKICEICGEEKQ